MLVKDGVAYLQAGVSGPFFLAFAMMLLTIGQGGIVFDSDPYDEWIETINKLGEFISLVHLSRAISTSRRNYLY